MFWAPEEKNRVCFSCNLQMEVPGNELVVDKYLKQWYQFASNPHFYEPGGSYDIRALYQRDAAGNIIVTNTLRYRGKSKTVRGQLLTTGTPGRFKVRLERAFLWFAITAPYNVEVVYADEQGEYVAAIVEGGGSYYALSATPEVPCELQQKILAYLGPKRTVHLNFTAQTCQ
jgi:lipocalin